MYVRTWGEKFFLIAPSFTSFCRHTISFTSELTLCMTLRTENSRMISSASASSCDVMTRQGSSLKGSSHDWLQGICEDCCNLSARSESKLVNGLLQYFLRCWNLKASWAQCTVSHCQASPAHYLRTENTLHLKHEKALLQ